MLGQTKHYIRLIHTISHLKFSQIYFLIRRRLIKKKSYKKIAFKQRLNSQVNWEAPFFNDISWDGESFKFLGLEEGLEEIKRWDFPKKPMLWRYNLHYLNVLDNDLDESLKTEILNDWVIKNNRSSSPSWDPYVISLRVVNILKFIWRSGLENNRIDESLWSQAIHLQQNLEYDLQANHLFTNAKALVFLGAYFGEPFLSQGVSLLDRELDEQFLSDGGHYERSPMYQAVMLRDLLELFYLLNQKEWEDDLKLKIKSILPKALAWLEGCMHDDLEFGYFNDSVNGVGPALKYFYEFFEKVSLCFDQQKTGLTYYKESGFFSFHNKSYKVIADIGKPGPDYQPGHAHAEVNSFELTWGEKRLLSNTGVSTYDSCEDRFFERSTHAHNTVVLSDENSSDVWSSFRLGKRVNEVNVVIGDNCVSSEHNGYVVRGLGSEHKREWFFGDNELKVVDTLGKKSEKGEAFYHLHPGVSIEKINENTFHAFSKEFKKKVSFQFLGGKPSLFSSYWCSGFGQKVNRKSIRILFVDRLEVLIRENE